MDRVKHRICKWLKGRAIRSDTKIQTLLKAVVPNRYFFYLGRIFSFRMKLYSRLSKLYVKKKIQKKKKTERSLKGDKQQTTRHYGEQ